jgi:hypothetical protein
MESELRDRNVSNCKNYVTNLEYLQRQCVEVSLLNLLANCSVRSVITVYQDVGCPGSVSVVGSIFL